jgi:ribosomal-protein-serine acetyltransferase
MRLPYLSPSWRGSTATEPSGDAVQKRRALSIPSRAALRAEPLRTERIHLTPIDSTDGPELWDVIESSREHLERWLPWVPFNNTPEASRRYANACASDWDAGRAVRFGIRDRDSDALLGVVGLDSCVHLHLSCELGYWLRREAAGKGLMTEAAGACVKFAFARVGVHRIRCAAATGNQGSLAVIGRLEFKPEGIARQAAFVAGRWVDHAVFSKLSTD